MKNCHTCDAKIDNGFWEFCEECREEYRKIRLAHRVYKRFWDEQERLEKKARALAATKVAKREKKVTPGKVGRPRSKGLTKTALKNKIRSVTRGNNPIPQPCEECGSTENIHRHHLSYDRTDNFVWLCAEHHALRHPGLEYLILKS